MPAAARIRIRRPAEPTKDARFQKVLQRLNQGASRLRQHPTAKKKADEASAAAKGPANEKAAGAKAKQVDKIKEAPTKKPESNSFLALLRAEIEKAMPKTLDDTEKFMKGGSAGQLKGSLQGNVGQQKEKAAGGVAKASTEAPNPSGVPAKQDTPIPGEPTPAVPDANAAEGMPAPKPDAEVSLQDSKQDAEAEMKEAEVTTPQLQKANDPRFSAVLTAKGAVDKQADTAPAQYRASEKGTLAQAAGKARADQRKGVALLLGVKGGSKTAVVSRQAAAKAKEEAERKKVTDTIEGIYTKTKEKVENKLNALDEEVTAFFDRGTDAALAAMKEYVEKRIEDYKDERYSGIIGKGRWIRDQFKGLPAEANAFYVEGRNLFTRQMDAVIVRVANLVEQRLREAKALVAAGQAEIKAYVDTLPKNLKSVGQAAQKEVAGRFAELERGIDDKKNQLAQALAQKYKEAFDKADQALKEIQDANKGLVQKFVEKLGEIIKIIREFKDKLMAVLRKGWSVIKAILSDPIGFLGNLLSALKQGFNQFKANIGKWLLKGIIGWLFGALAEAGVTVPADFSPASILKLVLQILGITYERIRAKAVKLLGPTAVAIIEKLIEYVKVLFQGGPAALWEKVKEDLADLKDRVLGEIRNMIIMAVIKAAVMKIVSMFNPVGAFIQAVLAIYNTVMFIIEQASRILALIESVVNSVAAIVAGAIGAAANRIEQALGAAIPLVIAFLARLVGVGDLPKRATAVVKKVQDVVDKAIDKALAKLVKVVKKLVGRMVAGKLDERTEAEKKRDLDRAVRELRPVMQPMLERGTRKLVLRARILVWKRQYRLTDLKAESGRIRAVINPTADMFSAEEVALGAMLEPILREAERLHLRAVARNQQSAQRVERGAAAARAGQPLPSGMTQDEMVILMRRQGLLQRRRVLEREAYQVALENRRRYVPRAGAYVATHLPGMEDKRSRFGRGLRWFGSVNRRMDEGGGETPAITALREEVEVARHEGNLPAARVGSALVGAAAASGQTIPVVADVNVPGAANVVSPAEITFGRMAPMATESSAGAGSTAENRAAASPAQIQAATNVRQGSYAVIFNTLSAAMRQSGDPVMKLPGRQGEALRAVVQAFDQWKAIVTANPEAGNSPAANQAAQRLRDALARFLAATRG